MLVFHFHPYFIIIMLDIFLMTYLQCLHKVTNSLEKNNVILKDIYMTIRVYKFFCHSSSCVLVQVDLICNLINPFTSCTWVIVPSV